MQDTRPFGAWFVIECPHLKEVVEGYRIALEPQHVQTIRAAIAGGQETSEDALDFFKDVD